MKINHFLKYLSFLYTILRLVFSLLLFYYAHSDWTDRYWIRLQPNNSGNLLRFHHAVFSYSRDNGSATLLFLRVRPSVFVPVEANPEQINFLFFDYVVSKRFKNMGFVTLTVFLW